MHVLGLPESTHVVHENAVICKVRDTGLQQVPINESTCAADQNMHGKRPQKLKPHRPVVTDSLSLQIDCRLQNTGRNREGAGRYAYLAQGQHSGPHACLCHVRGG